MLRLHGKFMNRNHRPLALRSPASSVALALCAMLMVALAAGCRAPATSAPASSVATQARPTPGPSRAVPTLVGTPLVPRPDACKIVFVVGTGIGTVARLEQEHGTPTGCGSFYYRADGSACVRAYVVGPNRCPDSPAPRMIVYLVEPGTAANPRPGFLTCVRPEAAAPSVCGVDNGYSTRADLSSAWTFSPFPAGAQRLDPQFSKLPTPLPPVNGYQPVDPSLAYSATRSIALARQRSSGSSTSLRTPTSKAAALRPGIDGLEGRLRYRSWNSGLRFSAKARRPSR